MFSFIFMNLKIKIKINKLCDQIKELLKKKKRIPEQT